MHAFERRDPPARTQGQLRDRGRGRADSPTHRVEGSPRGNADIRQGESGHARTEGSGPDVDELKKAWLEVSKMPKVSWTKTVVEGSGANRVTAKEAEEYGREHVNYPYAVLDTLSRRYGFNVDIER